MTQPSKTAHRRSHFLRAERLVSYALIALGAYLRMGDQASRDFWLDEAWRVHTVRDAPHPFAVSMPVQPFEYLLARLGELVFGHTEFAFRCWSVLFSLLALALFWALAERLLNPPTRLIALFFFATSAGAIEHAYEWKPYSYEMALALFVVWFSLGRDFSIRKELYKLLSLELLIACSSSLFAFYWMLIPWALYQRRCSVEGLRWSDLFPSTVPFLAAAALQSFMLPLIAAERIFRFWMPFYLGNAPGRAHFFWHTLPEAYRWYVLSALPWPVLTSPLATSLLSILLLLLGLSFSIRVAYQRAPVLLILFVGPLLMQIVLSALNLYPAFTRVAAFYFPSLLLSTCLAAQPLLLRITRGHVGLPVSMLCLFCIAIYLNAHPKSTHPGIVRNLQEIEAAVVRLRHDATEGDMLLLSDRGYHLWRAYVTTPLPDLHHKIIVDKETRTPAQRNAFFRGELSDWQQSSAPQLWILLVRGDPSFDAATFVRDQLSRMSNTRTLSYALNGAVLFELQRSTTE